MRKNLVFTAIALGLIAVSSGASAAPADEAAIRALLDGWTKSFHDRSLNGIMAMYAPGKELVAYDIVPPLRYVGYDAYRKDYVEFLAQYRGPIVVEYRDLTVVADGSIGFAHGLERMTGTLKGGQKSDMWTRFTSCFRKINGRWYDVHDHVSVPADLASGKAETGLVP